MISLTYDVCIPMSNDSVRIYCIVNFINHFHVCLFFKGAPAPMNMSINVYPNQSIEFRANSYQQLTHIQYYLQTIFLLYLNLENVQ